MERFGGYGKFRFYIDTDNRFLATREQGETGG